MADVIFVRTVSTQPIAYQMEIISELSDGSLERETHFHEDIDHASNAIFEWIDSALSGGAKISITLSET
tara:strand:+ start:1211 stop:1417 length:207 start_codon:yes stop_codon:yes gene_type:complete